MTTSDAALREAIEEILQDSPGAISALYGPFTDDPEKEAEIVWDSMIDRILALFQSEKQQLLAEIKASLPEKRTLPPINSDWNQGWMQRQGGVIDFNQALDQVTAVLEGYQKQGKGGE